ncbi:hypothetical protein OG416_39165 (plasmid) [Streptomyces longwoodensis]|uniref:hypothetical protein n=1 Tax=Streptomyces longwoodensis TaxID=68231 RepID=UPI00352D3A48|nr:hypothetical protein OG416_39165 [Streptomyces longwoodensis]
MTERPTVYDTAPDLYEEHQELVRTMAQLPLRERLVRRAALADRSTLDVPEADGKATQDVLSAALKLAAHDQAHGTAAGPVAPQALGPRSPAADLRGYIRQEYAAWRDPQPAVWLVTRGEDPGATPAEDEATARAYAEGRYREDEDPDEPAVLRWDDEGELIDDTLDPSYPYTGWTVRRERVLRAADLPTTAE